MAVSIAHLGPSGTNAETAALQYAEWLTTQTQQEYTLCHYPSNAQTLQAVAQGQVDLAVVPVENSIEGSVTMTLDTFWRLDGLQIQSALELRIVHAFLSYAPTVATIQTVYSHPQALSQCQEWLETNLPEAHRVPMQSTTEALRHLAEDPAIAAISTLRAAELYQVPILACPINDHPENCTRFWVVNMQPSTGGSYTSIAFAVHDVPGALVKPLQIFADRHINMSRIESRPTKRLLGDYLFFVDLEADIRDDRFQEALAELVQATETLKVLGSYDILPIQPTL
ncbi:MAG: prephenate dehydratase [Leptolyngbyaceae cyanobacterium bins.349]|nr:prephenate dehydratase [Leptolyngbyaceae cyanobacterium bins.349]